MNAERALLPARVVGVSRVGDPPVLVAACAEQADGSGFGLEFQLASSFDDQDRRLGMDTYCVCTSEGATHYGGVLSLAVNADLIDLRLDPAAAAGLGVPERIRLCLLTDGDSAGAFVHALRAVLGRA